MPWSTCRNDAADLCHSGERAHAGLGSSKDGSDREEARGDARTTGLVGWAAGGLMPPTPEGNYGRIAKGFDRGPGKAREAKRAE